MIYKISIGSHKDLKLEYFFFQEKIYLPCFNIYLHLIFQQFKISIKMIISQPQPAYPNGISIYVSEPAVPKSASAGVIQALKQSGLSSKAIYNTRFESNLETYFQLPVACSVSNGYTGLYVILKSINLEKSDKNEIIIPNATMVAVVNAVIDNALEPILVDNDKDRLNPSANSFIAKVSDRTKAIIVIHTFGTPVFQFQKLVQFCSQNNIFLIEDIAQAIGVSYKGKLLGTYGDFCSASLYANKLITCGDGGFILSKLSNLRDKSLKQLWLCIINHGFSKGYHFNHTIQTGNYRINGLGAAFIHNFPSFIDNFIKKRKNIDKVYRKLLNRRQFYTLMQNNDGGQNTPWVFSLRVEDHQTLVNLRQHLANFGIQTRPYFKPINTQTFFQTSDQIFPNSITQYLTGLYLPTYQQLSQQMQKYISECVNHFFLANSQFSYRHFLKEKKRQIDLLNTKQIQEFIIDLQMQVKKGQSSSLLTEGARKKLKDLGKSISESQKLQITQRPQINKKEKVQIQLNKTVIARKNHSKDFGKKVHQFNEMIGNFSSLYQDYFELEKDGRHIIIWQKQYDKSFSIKDYSQVSLNLFSSRISKTIARQIFKFHRISEEINEKLSSKIQIKSLADILRNLQQSLLNNLDTKLDQFFCPTIKFLRPLIQSIMKKLVQRQKQFQPLPNRIIHGKLTTFKIISSDQGDKIQLYDFQNIQYNQILYDLSFGEERYGLIKLNHSIIDQYIKLAKLQSQSHSMKKRILIIQISRLMQKILNELIRNTISTLSFREQIRKLINQIVFFIKIGQIKHKNHQQRYFFIKIIDILISLTYRKILYQFQISMVPSSWGLEIYIVSFILIF